MVARRQFVLAGYPETMRRFDVAALSRVLRGKALLASLPAWRDGILRRD